MPKRPDTIYNHGTRNETHHETTFSYYDENNDDEQVDTDKPLKISQGNGTT